MGDCSEQCCLGYAVVFCVLRFLRLFGQHFCCLLDAVVGTVGLVAAGGSLAARRVREGSLVLPTMESGPESVAAKRRSQPLQKSSGDEIGISKASGAESVDIISDE